MSWPKAIQVFVQRVNFFYNLVNPRERLFLVLLIFHFLFMIVCVQDVRMKVGDQILAMGGELVAGLSVDKVQTHRDTCA